jgi:hypothetical protein
VTESAPEAAGDAEGGVVSAILEALRDRHGALTLAGLLTLGQDDEESSRQEEILTERVAELELVIYMVESGMWRKHVPGCDDERTDEAA